MLNNFLKNKLVIAPFIVFLFFTGCYDIPYSIDSDGNALIQDELIGNWQRDASASKARFQSLAVRRDTDSPWYHYDMTDTDGPTREMKVIFHRVGSAVIASASARDGSQKSHSIFRVQLPADSSAQLIIEALDEKAPRFETSEQFKAFLESDAANKWFQRKMIFLKTE